MMKKAFGQATAPEYESGKEDGYPIDERNRHVFTSPPKNRHVASCWARDSISQWEP